MKYIVEESGKRLDAYITSIDSEITRTAAQRLIEQGNILVNGEKKKTAYKVSNGDIITIEKEEPKEIELKAQNIPIDIIYEDDDIIVVNKPKGMVVHPANGNPDGTLVNAIMAICKDSLSGIGGEIRPGIVHRLDKDTSGLLIVAKNDEAHIKMSKQIQDRKVEKRYIALVRGNVPDNEATIDMPIARSKVDRKKMAVDKNGKEAVTHFKVLKRYGNYTLLEIKIDTGRTHQIRVHFNYIGYPVHGDPVYGRKSSVDLFGQYLHSKTIRFVHPITKEELFFDSPLPPEFVKKLESLEQ